MTPTTPELLLGTLAALSEPAPPEAAEFMAGRVGVIGLINLLAAQEAEVGASVRVRENAAIRRSLAAAASAWDARLAGRLSRLSAGRDEDLSLSALDSANAELRRALIDLHALVDGEQDLESVRLGGAITRLLKDMADGRALQLPPMPPRG